MADELSIGLTKLLRKAQMADAHLLSAFSQRRGVVLGQVAVPDKSNEITAIDGCPLGSMLARLVLTGWVVTTDALFTQTDIAQAIGAAGGHYLMAVKGDQPTLHDALAFLFADLAAACLRTQETRLHGGRIERRVLRASTELTGDTDWLGMAQAVCMERRVTEKSSGKTRTERADAVTSHAPTVGTPAQLLALWREHWQIENKLHWIRDVTFAADRSTVRGGHPAGDGSATQHGDWRGTTPRRNQHRRCLSPLCGSTRARAHCPRPRPRL